jgi:hypothetical protein
MTKAGALVTAPPLTMACFFTPSSFPTDGAPLTITAAGGTGWQNMLDLAVPSSTKIALAETGSNNVFISTATDGGSAMVAGTLYHLAAVYASTSSRTCYRNGVPGTTIGGFNSPNSLTTNWVGISSASANTGTRGVISWIGFWAAALTTPEVAALSQGCHPRRIRPASLIASLNLTGGASPEPDLVSPGTWAVNGALTEANNPRIFY